MEKIDYKNVFETIREEITTLLFLLNKIRISVKKTIDPVDKINHVDEYTENEFNYISEELESLQDAVTLIDYISDFDYDIKKVEKDLMEFFHSTISRINSISPQLDLCNELLDLIALEKSNTKKLKNHLYFFVNLLSKKYEKKDKHIYCGIIMNLIHKAYKINNSSLEEFFVKEYFLLITRNLNETDISRFMYKTEPLINMFLTFSQLIERNFNYKTLAMDPEKRNIIHYLRLFQNFYGNNFDVMKGNKRLSHCYTNFLIFHFEEIQIMRKKIDFFSQDFIQAIPNDQEKMEFIIRRNDIFLFIEKLKEMKII